MHTAQEKKGLPSSTIVCNWRSRSPLTCAFVKILRLINVHEIEPSTQGRTLIYTGPHTNLHRAAH